MPISWLGHLVYDANSGLYHLEIYPGWWLISAGIVAVTIGYRMMREKDAIRRILELLEEILDILRQHPRLTRVQIRFGDAMADTGTLAVGQSLTATVQGFDQNGQPFTIDFSTFKTAWTNGTPAVASDAASADGSSDVITGVSAGVDLFTVSVTRPDGQVITSAQQPVTVTAPAPVLTSVKIDFGAPA